MACLRCEDPNTNGAQFCHRCLPNEPDFFSPWRQRDIREGIVRKLAQYELVSMVMCFVLSGIYFLCGIAALLIHNRLKGAYTLSDLRADMVSIYPVPIPFLFPTVYLFFFYMTVLLVWGFCCTSKRRQLMTKPYVPLLSVYGTKDIIFCLILSGICSLGINLPAMFCLLFNLNPHNVIRGNRHVRKRTRQVVRVNGTEIYFSR